MLPISGQPLIIRRYQCISIYMKPWRVVIELACY